MDRKKYDALDFENYIFKRAILKEKKFLKSMNLNVKFFLKRMILNEKNFVESIILKWKFFLSDFESTFLQRVRFQIEYSTTCQILNLLLLQKFAKVSCVHQNRARFGNVLMYGMGSVSQVILLG